jgi:hypothetical protein
MGNKKLKSDDTRDKKTMDQNKSSVVAETCPTHKDHTDDQARGTDKGQNTCNEPCLHGECE